MRLPSPVILVEHRVPPRLSDLPRPPTALFLRGELPRGPAVAIVGTRTPTREGEHFARLLARDLAAAGISVLSGGAVGIDTAAHRGALAVGGTTVVVAPAGFERPYPPENEELFRRIVKRRGAYVSLVGDDQPATRGAFFARNGCLVALAHAVVVVQAGLRSGARNAAAQARRIGRPLLVVPSSPWVGRGRGCIAELRAGAELCESARDVLGVLERIGCRPLVTEGKRARQAQRPEESEGTLPLPFTAVGNPTTACDCNDFADPALLVQVVQLIRQGAQHVDSLSAAAGLPVSVLQRVLLTLTLSGVLVSAPSGRLTICKSLD